MRPHSMRQLEHRKGAASMPRLVSTVRKWAPVGIGTGIGVAIVIDIEPDTDTDSHRDSDPHKLRPPFPCTRMRHRHMCCPENSRLPLRRPYYILLGICCMRVAGGSMLHKGK